MPHSTSDIPNFPAHLPQAQIQRIPLDALLQEDRKAQQDLWEACSTHGFFYLDLSTCDLGRSIVAASDELERLSHRAFEIPMEQKQAVSMAKHRSLFGYKSAGIVAQADQFKRRDVGEFWNVSKDEMLGQSPHPIPYPQVIQESRALLSDYMHKAHGIGMLVMDILAPYLGIPAEELKSRHRLRCKSGDHVRLTFGPGDASAADTEATRSEADTKITTFAHTDFGSVTLLFNWLGGLQIQNRETEQWEWVRPVPGCAILNLGDAMVEFAGGRVSSGRHRVVAAPGAQAALDRYSLVYFVRPEDDVVLEDLTPGAPPPKPEAERWRAGAWIDNRSSQMGNSVGKTD